MQGPSLHWRYLPERAIRARGLLGKLVWPMPQVMPELIEFYNKNKNKDKGMTHEQIEALLNK